MECYNCAKADSKSEAVAVCSVCGRGLCPGHAIERDIPLVRRVSGWGDQSLIHILCGACAEVKALTD
ncbi:MAG: hypothetical protein C0617_02730 [Desulfuromonas sp.]|uniref:DUF2180 family protein n=1 Tax=Desulfuromonas sp. TaxID=892 RepID=UPI000CB8A533|nr:DUF2180 family protein [Desulfuromonas sp.]PLX85933.1 MAG: hypothetical protein C0617_02730 [Desulfuromonas sp.]